MTLNLSEWKRHYATNVYGVYAPLASSTKGLKWISVSNLLTNLVIYLTRVKSPTYQAELQARRLTQMMVQKQFGVEWPEYMLADLADLLKPVAQRPDIVRDIDPPRFGGIPRTDFSELTEILRNPQSLGTLSENQGIPDLLNERFQAPTQVGEQFADDYAKTILPDALADLLTVGGGNDIVLNDEGRRIAELLEQINAIGVTPTSDGPAEPFPLIQYEQIVLQLLLLLIKGPASGTGRKSFWERLATASHMGALPYIANTSPIGLMNVYHQQLTQSGEGYGPILQVLALQPGEQLEVSLEQETSTEFAVESEFEERIETSVTSSESNQTDISEEIASSTQRSSSIAIGASAGTNFAVFNASGSANLSSADGYQQSDKIISKNVRSYSKRISEKRTKRLKVVTKSIERETTRQSQRRSIQNPADVVKNYALRQIHRVVDVSVFRQPPRLVWNLYLSDPARYMNQSSYVFFADKYGLQDPANLADLPPFPDGGSVKKSLKVGFTREGGGFFLELPFVLDKAKVPVGVEVTNVRDLRGPRKKSRNRMAALLDEDIAIFASKPGANGQYRTVDEVRKDNSHSETSWFAKAQVAIGDGGPFQVDFTVLYEPSSHAMKEVEAIRAKIIENVTYEQAQEQFVKKREHLERQSSIRPRPSDDLRQEERFAIMNRVITHAFGRQEIDAVPPGEIESLRTLFDLDEIFVFIHPSWWKPKDRDYFAARYPITDGTQPAPLGSSLGWVLQLDGDEKRNYFINSPWVQVCIPMAEGREKDAAAWLASRIEGTVGVAGDTTEDRIAAVEKFTEDVLKEQMQSILGTHCELEGDGADDKESVIEDLIKNGQRLDRLFDEKGLSEVKEGTNARLTPVDQFEVMDVADGLAYQEINMVSDGPVARERR